MLHSVGQLPGFSQMTTVGIIANPAASKDIRRLVAQGRVVPDWEKVNIVRRALVGLQSAGVDRVAAMPDSGQLCQRAAADPAVSVALEMLPMSPLYAEGDTTRAAALLAEREVGCLITLGGDGTNRAVAMGSCQLPIVAISTGTNNIFPVMVEGTLAGIAAGLVAAGRLDLAECAIISKTLLVRMDDGRQEIALVDVAISRERYVATRAIWDLDTVYEVFLTRAEPAGIGLSSIGGRLLPVSIADIGGLRYRPGRAAGASGTDASGSDIPDDAAAAYNDSPRAVTVMAPVAPGLVQPVSIADWSMLQEGVPIMLEPRHCTIALDGERAFTLTPDDRAQLMLARNGPPVVQVQRTLRRAAELGLFHGV